MSEDHDNRFSPRTQDGEFVRATSGFRNWITADGSPGPSGAGGFAAEPSRYHLYVSLACPWAQRTLIFRALKGLEEKISVDVVHPHMGGDSWHFDDSFPGSTRDSLHGSHLLADLYQRARPGCDDLVTVPTLWDKQRDTLVNNESSEIIRMLNSAFDDIGAKAGDYYPAPLREEIDAVNQQVYDNVNNGVYRAGFASSQSAYEAAIRRLFGTLDELESRLEGRRWLVGDQLTEADLRLFPTLIRFDAVYHGHFKCNLRQLRDYPNLWHHTCRVYHLPGVAKTVNFEHIKQHYYVSHPTLNPSGIVPLGPDQQFPIPDL
jgi:putative glutathione S-transferase